VFRPLVHVALLACFALPAFAQVSAPTVLAYLHVEGDTDGDITTPEAGNVTPTANALVVLGCQWGANGGSGFPVTRGSIDTPTWATQAWTLAEVSSTSFGASDSEVAIYWTFASASPGADNTTLTISGGFGEAQGSGCGMVEYASGFDTGTPIRQAESTGTAATLAGGTALTANFPMAPLSTSQLFAIGRATPDAQWGLSSPVTGWTKLGNPGGGNGEEGFSQTSYMATDDNSTAVAYGGTFGDATPSRDQEDGAAFAAIEIQAAAAGSAAPPASQYYRRRR
jgi:hypothetical protein